ncbi:MAG: putative DNA binding domain-containing protein, partial [Gammaproteobacteria bacterium]|nr:putative DNA binding domain-containing protein [Gammaproteobacteria bacterium]
MTTKAELLELISHGENSGVEFKRDDVRPEQLAKEIVAFANFQGGQVLLGVDDDGSICGIQRENLEHWLVDTVFSRYIHPQIIPYYKEIRISENQHVAVITISTGVTKPYVVRQRDREDIYIRVGSTSRLATREQQARLFASGGMLYAEKLPVSGSGLSDLSQDRLKDYLLSIVGENEVPDNSKGWHTLLSKLGFMTESETGAPPVCTIAGLILFGLSPRRLLPNAGIRWMAFAGKEKSYKSLEDRLFDEPLVPIRGSPSGVGGHILENGLLESLFMAMRPFVSEELDNLDDSLRRQRSWAYPLEALRESVINAVVHRDWTRYEEIEVVRYADCLSVLSPGAL